MDPTRIGLFNLAEKRLAWIAQRQATLASNIANVNSPGFKPRDVQSFNTVLAGQRAVVPARTQNLHMAGNPKSISETTVPIGGKALDGNAVALDEQLVKVADTEQSQAVVTTIWKKYASMFSIALGR
jgi:flagellar basal-body rod protein FlgB